MKQTHFSLLAVSFAAAMAVFFAAPFEWPIWVTLALAVLAAALLEYAGRRDYYGLMRIGLVVLVFAVGFGWAQGRTHWQQATTGSLYIPPDRAPTALRGVVDWSEPTPRGSKTVLRLTDYQNRPVSVQLYGKRFHAARLQPGCTASLSARLQPLPLPVVVDGHDPRLRAWFAGQRGRGFIKQIKKVTCPETPSFAHRLARWRLGLAAHYRDSMSAEAGPIAAALITGVRGMIDSKVRQAFRHSGLAHMLAISGLHMALFAGSVYALIRLLAAAWPALVLRHDMRKPAAIIALLAATAYLLISGASFATQRAYIMLAIFFLAVLLDRPAITMRNVLWAAILVLLLQPQAIVQVGFQMSFAAVMALVAVYEIWQRADRLYVQLAEMPPWQRAGRLAWRYASALTLTSLIAGSVTGFIALTQFYQIGTYGLPANLLAMPVFGTLIMPLAPISLLLSTVNFDWPAMAVMQFGIETVITTAGWITAFDGAVWRAGASPDWVLPVAAVGFVWLCLLPNRWRFIGVLPMLIASLAIGQGNRPVAHLFGRDAIVVQEQGLGLKLLRRNGHGYEHGVMARFHGQDPEDLGDGLSCAPGCGVRSKDLMVVAYLTHPRRLTTACHEGDLVILPFHTARYPCKAMLLDETKLQRGQPLQINSDGRRLYIKKPAQGRLWQRPALKLYD